MKDSVFSICIPVRNDLENLQRCLSAFRYQDLSDCEILVCDDGSTTPVSTDDFAGIQVPVTLVRQVGQGPSAARNHLAQIATGEYLFFIDADTLPSPDMLESARQILDAHPGLDVFYGSYDDEPADRSLISSYRNLLHHHTHHQSALEGQRVTTFWCGCGVIRRKLYCEVGGLSEFYDKPSIEDIELGARLSARGTGIEVFPNLQVKHLKKWTLGSWLYTDLFRRGIPWVRLMRSTKRWSSQLNFSWKQRIASLASVAFLLASVLTIFYPPLALLALAALAVFAIPNLPFFALVLRKRGAVVALMVVPLHLVYALVCVTSVGAALLYPPLKLPPPQRLWELERSARAAKSRG